MRLFKVRTQFSLSSEYRVMDTIIQVKTPEELWHECTNYTEGLIHVLVGEDIVQLKNDFGTDSERCPYSHKRCALPGFSVLKADGEFMTEFLASDSPFGSFHGLNEQKEPIHIKDGERLWQVVTGQKYVAV